MKAAQHHKSGSITMRSLLSASMLIVRPETYNSSSMQVLKEMKQYGRSYRATRVLNAACMSDA